MYNYEFSENSDYDDDDDQFDFDEPIQQVKRAPELDQSNQFVFIGFISLLILINNFSRHITFQDTYNSANKKRVS
jgi:hypothetical protein